MNFMAITATFIQKYLKDTQISLSRTQIEL